MKLHLEKLPVTPQKDAPTYGHPNTLTGTVSDRKPPRKRKQKRRLSRRSTASPTRYWNDLDHPALNPPWPRKEPPPERKPVKKHPRPEEVWKEQNDKKEATKRRVETVKKAP